jgi:hypothetical protein
MEENPEYIFMTGAKPWYKDYYVGMACFEGSQVLSRRVKEYPEMGCEAANLYDFPSRPYLGVFRMDGQTFIPVARTLEMIEINEDSEDDRLDYYRFDLADYRLNEKTKAFGIRGGILNDAQQEVGYLRGGIYTEYLQIFMVRGKKLVNIFNAPMYSFLDTAEAVAEDGTPHHEISESQSTLHVLKTKTNGFYDWLLKTKSTGEAEQQVKYVWSKKVGRYVPKP